MPMCCDIRMMGFKGTSVLGYHGASKAQASKSGLDARIQVYSVLWCKCTSLGFRQLYLPEGLAGRQGTRVAVYWCKCSSWQG